MAKNWAIAIGINEYNYLQSLQFAKRDAQLMQEFLRTEAGFDQILFFSDDSPNDGGKPIRANLLRVLRQLSEKPRLGAGDNLWFFFSGHGMRHAGRDYLMPLDGDPGDIESTAISINHITERLRSCGADNVVLILDACRSLATRAGEGIGRQTAEQAQSTGVISIFSCSPNEYSYEIEALQQGAFTHALVEGLGIRGQCATVERLNQYLTWRVPELVRQHKKVQQTPYTIAEPIAKSHFILIPRHATIADIATLKNDAYRAAQIDEDLELAEQLWMRVLAAASGRDLEAVKALQAIERLRLGGLNTRTPSSSTERHLPSEQSRRTIQWQETQPIEGKKSAEVKLMWKVAKHKWLTGIVTVIVFGLGGFQIYRQTTWRYAHLENLLSEGKWKEADDETALKMWEIAGRQDDHMLRVEDFAKISCEDLRTIDTLWTKYSKEHFGFTAQSRIWQSGDIKKDLSKFVDRVEWGKLEKNGNFYYYLMNGISFDLSNPEGRLPWAPTYHGKDEESATRREEYLSRIVGCGI
jgi:uncharacterized caspase-like protein